jgi:ABC-type multidrug transport system ATPase subunit
MKIELQNLGKKYGRHWVFRNLNYTIEHGGIVAITGKNGSGKSTLLKAIAGYTTPTEGAVSYNSKGQIDQTDFNIAAPYLNLIDEFTLIEQLAFNAKFKRPLTPIEKMITEGNLEDAKDKYLSEFSSGMKQRVRLILAFFFQSQAILLDEPTSNLDEAGLNWYLDLLSKHRNSRTTIIASNQPNEYPGVRNILSIDTFKKIIK